MNTYETLENMGFFAGGGRLLSGTVFDKAIIGISEDGRAVYNYERMCHLYMKESGCTPEEAEDFVNFNAIKFLPYMGEKAPVIYYPLETEWSEDWKKDFQNFCEDNGLDVSIEIAKAARQYIRG